MKQDSAEAVAGYLLDSLVTRTELQLAQEALEKAVGGVSGWGSEDGM